MPAVEMIKCPHCGASKKDFLGGWGSYTTNDATTCEHCNKRFNAKLNVVGLGHKKRVELLIDELEQWLETRKTSHSADSTLLEEVIKALKSKKDQKSDLVLRLNRWMFGRRKYNADNTLIEEAVRILKARK